MTHFTATTTSTDLHSRRMNAWLIGVVFLVALLARAGVGVARFVQSGDPSILEFPDEKQYWHIASSIARGEGMRDELGFQSGRMPLYPAILSILAPEPEGVAMAKALQWMVGSLSAPIIALLGLHLAGRRVAYLAGMVVAADPFLSFFSSLLLTETLAITAVCVLWLLLAQLCFPTRALWTTGGVPRLALWIWTGLVASICVYLRESNLGLALLGFAFVATMTRRQPGQVAGAAIAAFLIVASLVPWAVRNQRMVGEWVWLTTRSGVSLYDGVGPQATGASDLGNVQNLEQAAGLSEAEWNRHFKKEAWSAIQRDPQRVIELAWHKLARMWNPFPNVETYRTGATRWVSILWTLPLYLLALVGACRLIHGPGTRGRSLVLFLLLPALYFSLVHAFYVGSVRYRLPAMPMVALLAATAFSRPKENPPHTMAGRAPR